MPIFIKKPTIQPTTANMPAWLTPLDAELEALPEAEPDPLTDQVIADQSDEHTNQTHRSIRAEITGPFRCEAEGLVGTGDAPVRDLCRRLIEAGGDPSWALEVYRADELSLIVFPIGALAVLPLEDEEWTGSDLMDAAKLSADEIAFVDAIPGFASSVRANEFKAETFQSTGKFLSPDKARHEAKTKIRRKRAGEEPVMVSSHEIQHAETLLKKLRMARDRGDAAQLHTRIGRYLTSFAAKYVAVEEAYMALDRHLRPSRDNLRDIAKNLDAWKGSNEKVSVYLKRKSPTADNGRPISCFGIENRALQYLVLRVLQQLAQLHPAQYLTRGGTKQAIIHLAERMQQGPIWACEIDIKDCYSSFDGNALVNLIPLPKEVTRSVIIPEHLNYVPAHQLYDLFGSADDEGRDPILLSDVLAAARLGIPQGSATSNLVAEIVLALPLQHVPSIGSVFAYADNVLLVATKQQDLESMTQAFWSSLAEHPVGQLQPTNKFFRPGTPVHFLGHRLTRKNGGVFIEPTPQNQQKFNSTICRLNRTVESSSLSPIERAKAKRNRLRYLRSWTAAFSLCQDVAEMRKELLG